MEKRFKWCYFQKNLCQEIYFDFYLKQCQKWLNEKMKFIMNNNCYKKNVYKISKKDYLKNGQFFFFWEV